MLDVPTLETQRLIMRGWDQTDFEPLARFLGDEELTRFVGGPSVREDSWRRLATMIGHWVLRDHGLWALEAKSDGRLLGWCGLLCPEGWPEPEIGWSLFAGEHGKGFATEAALRVRDYAYRDLGWKTLMSFIHPDNLPSIRVAERLGAGFERAFVIRGSEVGLYRHPGP